MEAPFVTQIDLALANTLQEALIEQGFILQKPPYTLFQGTKEGICCTLYTSGKLVVQGKKKGEFIEFYLEPELLHTFTFNQSKEEAPFKEHIGSDESGKGDYFGPLCIAAVYASKEDAITLKELGVKDSKKLSDKQILILAKKIRAQCSHHIIKISPEKYNELIEKFGNLNFLMAWAHATAIDALHKKTHCKEVLVDKFAHEVILERAIKQKKLILSVTQRVRAEEDLVVAAASILARSVFVEEMARLSQLATFILPKGASKKCIEIGKAIVEKQGKSFLSQVAKMHFKTTQEILG